jgi:hypothetical protein
LNAGKDHLQTAKFNLIQNSVDMVAEEIEEGEAGVAVGLV